MRYRLSIIFLLIMYSCSNPLEQSRRLDSEKLEHILQQKERSLIYIYTTWCSGCRYSLQNELPHLMQDLDRNRYQLILIAASKDRLQVDSLVSNSNLNHTSYFLDFVGPDKGKIQMLGIRHFLSANFPNQKIFQGGIPVFFLVDREKNVLIPQLPHSYDEAIQQIAKR